MNSEKKFYIGDEVKILNEASEGIVKDISEDEIMVLIDDFEYPYSPNELIKKSPEEHKLNVDVPVNIKKEKHEKVNRKQSHYLISQHIKEEKTKGRKKGKKYAEINLHYEEIAANIPDICFANKLDLQFYYFKKCFEEARELKIKKIIIIHGQGKGLLKETIKNYARGFINVQVEDASFAQYGRGATEIIIKGGF